MGNKIKVLVADDSAFMRLLITDILSSDSDIEVIDTAVDGQDAFVKSKALKPDVLLLDMNMGEYGGLYAVQQIMASNPMPILILSSVGNTNLEPIFDALSHGAVDYLNKPQRGGSKVREIEGELINRIKSASRATPKGKTGGEEEVIVADYTFKKNQKYKVIVIGASTGGPSAVEKIVRKLPGNLTVPVIICQHMPANFIGPFVKRLNALSSLNVVMGSKGMQPQAGNIIIAPGHENMILSAKGRGETPQISFTTDKYPEYNNPSINAIMESVADCYGKQSIGVVLTGMGKDGANGLKKMKDAGAYTIAQDKASCVIYGMPKVATERGAVTKSMHIRDIADFLVKTL